MSDTARLECAFLRRIIAASVGDLRESVLAQWGTLAQREKSKSDSLGEALANFPFLSHSGSPPAPDAHREIATELSRRSSSRIQREEQRGRVLPSPDRDANELFRDGRQLNMRDDLFS
jgi:hypothetical protein